MVAEGPEEQLAWEARQRPRAAIAAAMAGVFTLSGAIALGTIFRDVPGASFADALGRVAEPGGVGASPSLRTALFEYYDDRIFGLFAASTLTALGMAGMAYALWFLGKATRARRPEIPRFALWLPLAGGAMAVLATLLRPAATTAGVRDFLNGPRTVDAAQDVFSSSLGSVAGFVGLLGSLLLGVAFVLIALNAMRAGLLTRFLGILGVISGVLLVVPLGSPLPIVQCFWLFALSLMFLGRLPSGVPPAWRTGSAEPWPSQQQVREQRQQAMAERRAAKQGAAEPVEEDEAAPVGVGADDGESHPASKKRKRKRRA